VAVGPIIRGTGTDAPRYVYDVEPNKPKEGYGALAWASPMWITVEK